MTEIFEARKPKDPAVIAEIDGTVELLGEKRRGKRTIIVRSESGIEREHLVSHGKHLRVHAGDFVRAGEALVDGPLVPHDILRISGEEAVQQYLTREIQNVYRSQRVEINDKHIEIIVAQMLRKVRDRERRRHRLAAGQRDGPASSSARSTRTCMAALKITEKGDSDFAVGSIVPKDAIEQVNAQIEALGGDPVKGTKPKPATASTQLLGITKASVQSASFISAASFQETTKVLTEAALAGKVDRLVGLKENVILGHLIPAGTGFPPTRSRKSAFGRTPSKPWLPRRIGCSPRASRCWMVATTTAMRRLRRAGRKQPSRSPGRRAGCPVGRE